MNRKFILFIFIIFQTYGGSVWSEITFKPWFDKSDKLFANKILEIMPSLNNLRIGNPEAKNVIIEFIDYNCGYCKAIHSEIISLTNDKDLDLVVYFYQFPILNESSRVYAKILMAVAEQNISQGLILHNKIMNNKGGLNENKLNNFLMDIEINQKKFEEDIVSIDIDEKLEVSYYIAKRIGGSGTPLLIINNFVEQGFLKKNEIKKLFN